MDRHDLWNDNYPVDVPSSSCTTTIVTTITTTDPSSCNCIQYTTIAVMICIVAVPLIMVIIGLIVYIVNLRKYKLSAKYDSIPESPIDQPLLE